MVVEGRWLWRGGGCGGEVVVEGGWFGMEGSGCGGLMAGKGGWLGREGGWGGRGGGGS